MTATERLRELLSEREEDYGHLLGTVFWKGARHGHAARDSDEGDKLIVTSYYLTPQQAIAETLGRGTCHIVKTWSDSDYVDGWRYRCSECMCFIPVIERDPETGDVISAANYCPNCGRRVVAGDA